MLNILNRNRFKTFPPSPVATYDVDRIIESNQAVRYSPDEEFEELKKKHQEILISNPEYENGNKKTFDGIFSPWFGPDGSGDNQAFSCPCRKTIGSERNGQICPHCGKPVTPIKIDLSRQGHIDIAPFHILTYHGYLAMKKVLGKKLDAMFKTSAKIDISGKIIPTGEYNLMELYEKYDEEFYPITGLEKKYAFMTKIPVSSAKLRPLIKNGANVTILEENKKLLSILRLKDTLRANAIFAIDAPAQNQRTLNAIQRDFLDICTITKGLFTGKGGDLRKFLASGRIDNSSRMVISLGMDLKPYEIDIPYETAVVIYEELIVYYLCKMDGISVAKALSIMRRYKNCYNKKIHGVINQLLRMGNGLWALINRNPTINETGIFYMRVRRVHQGRTEPGNDVPENPTLRVPPDILDPMGADFDGDQMTYGAVKNPNFHVHFLTMCPSYAFIDRATGEFNRGMGFRKEYGAILSVLWDIGSMISDYVENPCEDTFNRLSTAGLPNPHQSSLNPIDDESLLAWDGTGLDPIFKSAIGE